MNISGGYLPDILLSNSSVSDAPIDLSIKSYGFKKEINDVERGGPNGNFKSGETKHWKKTFVRNISINLESSEESSSPDSIEYLQHPLFSFDTKSGLSSNSIRSGSGSGNGNDHCHFIPLSTSVVVGSDEYGNNNIIDEKYIEKRRRNNIAAKKSRDAKKNRTAMAIFHAQKMEEINAELKAEVLYLRKEAIWLRQLIFLNQNNHLMSVPTMSVPMPMHLQEISSTTSTTIFPTVLPSFSTLFNRNRNL